MKNFGKVFKFEMKSYLTNKVFFGTTILLVAAIAVAMFFPRIKESFASGKDAKPREDLPVMLVSADIGCARGDADALLAAFAAAFPDYRVEEASQSGGDAIGAAVSSGDADCAFVLNSPVSYTYYVKNISLYDKNAEKADALLRTAYQSAAMQSAGMTERQAQDTLLVQISHETENSGKDQTHNFFYTYVMIFALYFVILLYGQMIAMNVATEKSSRAMELLITSTKPASMMFGKIVAGCLAGLAQLAAVFGTALLCYNLNRDYLGGSGVAAFLFDIPPALLGYMLVFFVLGFFIYAFLYGATGSTVSKLEDVNTAVMPVTMIFAVSFTITMISMTSDGVDTVLMKVCSFVPLTSPMAMFTRLAMSTVPAGEVALSVVILVASVFGIGVLAAKIYRVGVLLYGNRPSLRSLLRNLKKR